MGVQMNVLGVRKSVESKSVETTRRHEPECLTLHIQYCENLKTHTLRIWMFSSLLPHRLLTCVGTSYLNIVCFAPEECINFEWITQLLKPTFVSADQLRVWEINGTVNSLKHYDPIFQRPLCYSTILRYSQHHNTHCWNSLHCTWVSVKRTHVFAQSVLSSLQLPNY